jgi:hypothetical protein
VRRTDKQAKQKITGKYFSEFWFKLYFRTAVTGGKRKKVPAEYQDAGITGTRVSEKMIKSNRQRAVLCPELF